MGSYDILTYLLDRANIHDTVTKMSLFLDLKEWKKIEEEVFAEELLVDYTSLLGGEPYTVTGGKQAETWEFQLRNLDAWQHVTTSILIDLPQPGEGVERPDKTGVLANCIVHLTRRDARGGPDIGSGGRYDLNLVRTNKEGNPWRISKMKTDMAWMQGNWDVYKGVENPEKEGK